MSIPVSVHENVLRIIFECYSAQKISFMRVCDICAQKIPRFLRRHVIIIRTYRATGISIERCFCTERKMNEARLKLRFSICMNECVAKKNNSLCASLKQFQFVPTDTIYRNDLQIVSRSFRQSEKFYFHFTLATSCKCDAHQLQISFNALVTCTCSYAQQFFLFFFLSFDEKRECEIRILSIKRYIHPFFRRRISDLLELESLQICFCNEIVQTLFDDKYLSLVMIC